MVNNKTVNDNIKICYDLVNEIENVLEDTLPDCADHAYLSDLVKVCLNNVASLSMKLEVASNITKST